jgi:AcrR family transcriptional regulator
MAALPPRPTLREDKRDAILNAARTTFATMGFTRATIEAIAAAARVSTRTIYKHFDSKDDLFAVVLESSARSVADDYEASVRAGVAAATTLHDRLMVLALARTKQALGHPEHFAMIRQIDSERQHVPPDVLAAWRSAGPDRVTSETIAQLRRLHDEGLLRIDDFDLAARHLFALTNYETDAQTPSTAATERAVRAGVEVFTRGYAP